MAARTASVFGARNRSAPCAQHEALQRACDDEIGELLEVDPVDTVESMIRVAHFEATLLDDGRLLNVDEPSSEMVAIVDIR